MLLLMLPTTLSGVKTETAALPVVDLIVSASDMINAPASDWTSYELPELVEFFGWMDALCVEAMRRGLKAPWPISNRMAEELNDWMADFGRGLTPAEALDNHLLGGSSSKDVNTRRRSEGLVAHR